MRALRAPERYGAGDYDRTEDATLLQWRLDLAHSAALRLDRDGLCRYDRRSGALEASTSPASRALIVERLSRLSCGQQ